MLVRLVLIKLGSVYGSVVDPDPKGSEPLCRIRIRIIGSDPEPKGSECKFYAVKLEFSYTKSSILTVSTKILNLKLVENKTSSLKIKFLHCKSLNF